MTTETQHAITAFFDTRAEAERAAAELAAAGVACSDMRLLPEADAAPHSRPSGESAYDHNRDAGGFWDSLKEHALPHEDRYAYAEGMSRGGVVLSVRARESELDRAAEILERHGSVDMDARETSWRREGWTGYRGSSAGGVAAGREAVIPVTEEQLRVGKRRVLTGRVRVRVYTVEVPVTAEVSLRDETVQVERHPVNRALTPEEEERLLRERVVEVEEHDEAPVVEKVPVVKEEIVVRKGVAEHVETIADTVRRTEVEIEDDRARSNTDNSTRRR